VQVLPCAIEQDVLIAVRVLQPPERKLIIRNVNQHFKPLEIVLEPKFQINSASHHWTNYFLGGYKGILEHFEHPPIGLQLLFDGTVPHGSGLSSSSAVVCASALATLRSLQRCPCISGTSLTRSMIADLAAKSERYMGVMSGGMDQAISMTAKAGYAKHIQFDPLTAKDVKLPGGVSIVVANTLVESAKYVTAATCYNRRVMECVLAAKLLSHKLGQSWTNVKRLRDVQEQTTPNRSLEALAEAVRTHLSNDPYSADDVAAALSVSKSDLWKNCFEKLTAQVEFPEGKELYLGKRAFHVFTETQRVLKFDSVANEQPYPQQLQELGELMNASHKSCKEQFDCSCAELDHLTSIARSAGALGSRLTGAGWGGSTVSLVKDEEVTRFINELEEKYFKPLQDSGRPLPPQKDRLFSIKPAAGASIITL